MSENTIDTSCNQNGCEHCDNEHECWSITMNSIDFEEWDYPTLFVFNPFKG